MALIQCPDCKRDLSSEAKLCPHCHCNVAGAWKRRVPKTWGVVIRISGLLTGVSFVALLGLVAGAGANDPRLRMALRTLGLGFVLYLLIWIASSAAAYFKYH